MRSLISLRPPEFGTAPFEHLDVGDASILAYTRGRFTVVANFSPDRCTVSIDSIEQVTGPATTDGATVTLPPFGWAWLVVHESNSE
jgi:hypothetical protein